MTDRFMKLITVALLLLATAQACRTKGHYPDCSSKDIELMDTCLLGTTIEKAITRMNIDTTNFIPMMFGREIDGIYVRKDSCKITVIVDTPFVMSNEQLKLIEINGRFNIHSPWKAVYQYILHRHIVAVCWRKEYAGKVGIVGHMGYHDCWDY
ncbi:MAG: hypothetical protein ACJ75B_06810 [Flavisolibacter sp.]